MEDYKRRPVSFLPTGGRGWEPCGRCGSTKVRYPAPQALFSALILTAIGLPAAWMGLGFFGAIPLIMGLGVFAITAGLAACNRAALHCGGCGHIWLTRLR